MATDSVTPRGVEHDYTADDLKKLPLRAIVAFAVRCARRVEGLALPPEGDPERARVASAITEALGGAEDFARGRPCPTLEAAIAAVETGQASAPGEIIRENAHAAVIRAAHAAATAARAVSEREEPPEPQIVGGGAPARPLAPVSDLSADLAALGAFTAARDAAGALRMTDDFTRYAAADLRRLLDLELGRYPEAGQPVDPSPEGPIGPLRSGEASAP